MIVFVLKHDMPNEFGEVLGVYSTPEKAEAARVKASMPYTTTIDIAGTKVDINYQRNEDDLSIEEHEVDQ